MTLAYFVYCILRTIGMILIPFLRTTLISILIITFFYFFVPITFGLLIYYIEEETSLKKKIVKILEYIRKKANLFKILILIVVFYFLCLSRPGFSIVIICPSLIVLYLLIELLKKEKEKITIDVCIVPAVTILLSGVYSFLLKNNSSHLFFFFFRGIWTHLSLIKEDTSISDFLIPHITACVGWVTFWAFWSQIRANALTVKHFKEEQIIDQYSKLLNVHRDNINDLKVIKTETVINKEMTEHIEEYDKNYLKKETLERYDALDFAKERYEEIYKDVKEEVIKFILSTSKNNKAAKLKYFALIKNKKILKPKLDDIENFKLWFNLQKDILEVTYYFFYEGSKVKEFGSGDSICEFENDHFKIKFNKLIGPTFRNKLTNYYRNLFYAVKYIVNQENQSFSIDQKRGKLKMLRAQMNNTEQLMLFYNWFSGYGSEWENEHLKEKKNKFLTEYKMIHNLNFSDLNETIFSDFGIEEDFTKIEIEDELKKNIILNLFNNLDFLFGSGNKFSLYNKKESKYSPLFEFED